MATKLTFGGIYTAVPGSFTRVDRSSLAPLSLSAVGVVAIVGEAAGGGAGGGTTILDLGTPQAVLDAYRSGPLKEAALIAFDPCVDNRVAGARKVLAVKTNPATQGSAILANADGNALVVTSSDYGLFTSQVNVQKGAGSIIGSSFTEVFQDESAIYDDVGGAAWFQLLYTAGSYATMLAQVGLDASLNPDKVHADGTIVHAAGEATATAFTNGDRVVIPASAAGNAGKTVTVYGVTTDGVAATEDRVLDGGGGSAAAAQHIRWRRVTAATIDTAVAAANILIQDEAVSTELTLVVAGTSVGLHAYTSVPVAHRPIALVSDGATTDPVILRGLNPAGAAQTEVVFLTGAVSVSGWKSWSQLDSIEIGGVPAARSVTVTARAADIRVTGSTGNAVSKPATGTYAAAFTSGDRATIVSGSALDTSIAVVVHGLTVAGAYQTETITTDAADGTTPVLGTSVWSEILALSISVYAVGAITASDEHASTVHTIVAKRKTSGVLATPSFGRVPVAMPVAGTTVDLVADGATVKQILVEGLDTSNVTQRELVTLTGAVAVTTTASWNRIDAIYVGDLEAARTVTLTAAYEIAGGYTTIQQLVDAYNARDGFTATAVTGAPTTNLISELDSKAIAGGVFTRNIFGLTVDFLADLTELIRYVNARSSLVVLSRPDGATCVPADTAAAVFLTGGAEGTTLYAHWVAALTKLLTTDEPGTIVCLSESGAVHAALDTHCYVRETTMKREADGKVGLAAGQTKAQVKAAILALNTRRVQVSAQEIQRYTSDGVLTWLAPMYQAAQAAGTQAGLGVSVPMTRKWAKVVSIRNHAGWDPTIDADELVSAGLLFQEKIVNKGFRWVRGVTTWLKDDNLANCEASVNHGINVFCKNFREWVEDRIGDPNFAGTLSALRGVVKAGLSYAIEEGWIVGYQNLVYTPVLDQIQIDLEVAPTLPLNFIPVNIHLVQSLS